MQAELPIYDCEEDAMKSAIEGLGGFKSVGPDIWPKMDPEKAAQRLRDCLNANRAEKLEYHEITSLFRAAKDAGIYAPFQWWANRCGFDALPVSKAEEQDRLITVVEQTSKALSVALLKLERLKGQP